MLASLERIAVSFDISVVNGDGFIVFDSKKTPRLARVIATYINRLSSA
jgi:hypothetical protein